jgi:ribose 5-phosphate isomerase A
MRPMTDTETAALAAHAVEYVRPGHVIGLGTGQAAMAFVHALGRQVQQGLRVTAVPTSQATATLAGEFGIVLASLDDVESIDVTVDGADEVDPGLDLIKGYGGALLREKIVAAASRRLVILVGHEKLVPVLGTRGRLPVEVIPFAAGFCRRRLADAGHAPVLRESGGRPVLTDNGNVILDCAVGPILDPPRLEETLRAVPGVVGTGLFLGVAQTVLVWDQARVTTLTQTAAPPSAAR